jgi:hypothetical protein
LKRRSSRENAIAPGDIAVALIPAILLGLFGLGFILYEFTQFMPAPLPTLAVVALVPIQPTEFVITFTPVIQTLTPEIPTAQLSVPTELTPTAIVTASHTPTGLPTQGPTDTVTPTSTLVPSETPEPPTVPAPTEVAYVGPTLDDFWSGAAEWRLDVADVGLPVGESDTLVGPDGQLWSYLHASFSSAQIRDEWGTPVDFPGCVTLWKSIDGGGHFDLTQPNCLLACQANPCSARLDQINQQQYPRVAEDGFGNYAMVYEWGGADFGRQSADGLTWTEPIRIPGTGVWTQRSKPCSPYSEVGPHPFVGNTFPYDCLVGGPPGIFIEDDHIYVFVGLGQNPGKMGCFVGSIFAPFKSLQPCAANPLFSGATAYGPLDQRDASTDAYFDFRTISAANVLRVGAHYYMAFEGVRGPGPGDAGDTQFGLGLARSIEDVIDGPWEKYGANPILMDEPGNVGIGHADLIVLNGYTYLYTATSASTRGRYVLAWK